MYRLMTSWSLEDLSVDAKLKRQKESNIEGKNNYEDNGITRNIKHILLNGFSKVRL